jgi:hypothetical protein
MKRIYVLFFAIAAVALLLAASVVRATGDGTPFPSPGVSEPPRQCAIDAGFGSIKVTVKIEAGPGTDLFPVNDTCGESKPCLRWDYRWTITAGPTGFNLTDAVASVDTDITVLAGTGTVKVSKLLDFLNIGEGERFLDFTASGTTWTASYWTPLNVTPGTLTAGFLVKKGFLPLAGHCALAGANNVVLEPYQPVPSLSYNQLPGCLVSFAVDKNGNPIPYTCFAQGAGCEPPATEGPAPCSESDMKIDGEPLLYGSPMQWTVEGPSSCTTCWRNTAGGKTCVTTQACK